MAEAYFAYGTTQAGFGHHRDLAALLGEPVGRFRAVEAHAVVVPRDAACSNPGCRHVHRMAALVRGHWDVHAQGDVFGVDGPALAALDALELSGPYVRETLDVAELDGERRLEAWAYPAREPLRWAELVWAGLADALESYPRELASAGALKPCCEREPGHPPPHDVVDPLDERRLAHQRLRNVARGYVAGAASLHLLEAGAAAMPWPDALAHRILTECIEWRADEAALRARIARVLEEG